jgi:hypothetical protein
VFYKTGRVLVDTEYRTVDAMDIHLYRPEISGALASGRGQSVRYSNTLKTDMLYSAKFIDPYVSGLRGPFLKSTKALPGSSAWWCFSGCLFCWRRF